MRWLALLLLTPTAWAFSTSPPTAKLTWDYDDPDLIDGFRIYCAGTMVWEGTDYPVMLADTTMQIGRQDCTVRAYNAFDESLDSNSVTVKYVTGKPVPASNLRTE